MKSEATPQIDALLAEESEKVVCKHCEEKIDPAIFGGREFGSCPSCGEIVIYVKAAQREGVVTSELPQPGASRVRISSGDDHEQVGAEISKTDSSELNAHSAPTRAELVAVSELEREKASIRVEESYTDMPMPSADPATMELNDADLLDAEGVELPFELPAKSEFPAKSESPKSKRPPGPDISTGVQQFLRHMSKPTPVVPTHAPPPPPRHKRSQLESRFEQVEAELRAQIATLTRRVELLEDELAGGTRDVKVPKALLEASTPEPHRQQALLAASTPEPHRQQTVSFDAQPAKAPSFDAQPAKTPSVGSFELSPQPAPLVPLPAQVPTDPRTDGLSRQEDEPFQEPIGIGFEENSIDLPRTDFDLSIDLDEDFEPHSGQGSKKGLVTGAILLAVALVFTGILIRHLKAAYTDSQQGSLPMAKRKAPGGLGLARVRPPTTPPPATRAPDASEPRDPPDARQPEPRKAPIAMDVEPRKRPKARKAPRPRKASPARRRLVRRRKPRRAVPRPPARRRPLVIVVRRPATPAPSSLPPISSALPLKKRCDICSRKLYAALVRGAKKPLMTLHFERCNKSCNKSWFLFRARFFRWCKFANLGSKKGCQAKLKKTHSIYQYQIWLRR